MKKTILLPTDFSENSWTAIKYAAKHASSINAALRIIHVYQSFYSVFAGDKFNEEVRAHRTDVANQQMIELLKRLKSSEPSVSVSGEIVEGVFRIAIEKILGKKDVDLIVMGTAGASGIKTIIGSSTLDIINIASVPVLAVPADPAIDINNVGLLTNFKEEEIDVLKRAMNILPPFLAVTLLHVREHHDESEEVMLDKWREIIAQKLPTVSVERKIGFGDDIPSTINDMIEKEKTDLLIVTRNEKSFYGKLFNRNLVRSIALSPRIPILFIRSK